jgi:uncharacterized protein YutE (UPF0331/DUF86 family)
MSSAERILKKIGKIQDYLKHLENYAQLDSGQIANNFEKKSSLERILYLMSDSLISLLEMVIAYHNLRKADSYHNNVDILREHDIISGLQARLLHQIIGFRNALSHDYDNLKVEVLKDIVDNRLTEILGLLEYFQKHTN